MRARTLGVPGRHFLRARPYYVDPVQTPPQISPDGAYWWDGEVWQPMPVHSGATSVAQPTAETPRPSWLPEGVEVPTPPRQPGIPLISQPAVIGASAGAAIYAPAWASETPPQSAGLSTTKKVLLWAGLVLSGAILLFGLLGVPIALNEAGTARSNGLTGAATLIVVGGAIFVPCLAVLLGFGPVVAASLHSLGILGCLVVLAMVVNTAVAVTSPVGGGRFVIPWGTLALVVFRAWRGRWLGAGIIGGVWAVAATITLTMARP
jgi:hypothetical protein